MCFNALSNIYDGKFWKNRLPHLEPYIRLSGNIPDSLLFACKKLKSYLLKY